MWFTVVSKDILYSLSGRKPLDQCGLSEGCISLQWKVNSTLLHPLVQTQEDVFHSGSAATKSIFTCKKIYLLLISVLLSTHYILPALSPCSIGAPDP